MKYIRSVLGLGMLAMVSMASAETKVSTVIDGSPVPLELTKMTFSDKNVILTFSDNSTVTADMSLVAITLDHSGSSAINTITADPAKAKGVYNLRGQYLGESPKDLQPGFYIVNGEKIYVK